MRKLMILIAALLVGALCGCYEAELDPPESYEMTNGSGETYTIEYRETNGFPDHGVEYSISSEGKLLIKYGGGDYKYLDETKPAEVLFLFSSGSKDYYYLRSKDLCYIFGGEYDFVHRSLRIFSDWSTATELEKTNAADFAKKLRKAFKEEDLKSLFDTAGYDPGLIMALYGLE